MFSIESLSIWNCQQKGPPAG